MPIKAKKNEKRENKDNITVVVEKKNKMDIASVVNPEDVIFALDIGTRTVVGIVAVPEKDKLKVIAAEVVEHKNRAMLDGQIHDISQVAEVAKEVKEKLEKKLGISLKKVAIAAAGRVLKTCEVKVERDIDPDREIDREIISSIEIEAIQQAQEKLDAEISKDEKIQFYCVGYSVINYFLNGYIISNPIEHKGWSAGVHVLATFLPRIVVDSLYAVMGKIGLEVTSLTLEPIAAINVTIPNDLRLLNLALVDIGAGTSDIALTKDGSVVAYAMVPMAGDEITEKIAQHYLVDFNTGEKIKISLSSQQDSVTFTDILGKKHTVPSSEIYDLVKPVVETLAETISQKIIEYNHKSPNAVFLIGGGSQIPGLTALISKHLELPEERVVVRGRDVVNYIKLSGKKLSGPEAITPLGIAYTAKIQSGRDFMTITVDGKRIRLFNSKRLKVADALVLTGYNPAQLIGRSGKSISFTLNGVMKTVRGEHGKPAEIYVNEKPANLDTALKVGDSIRVVPAEKGRDANVKVSDLVEGIKSYTVTFNSSKIDIGTIVQINGKAAAIDSSVSDGDAVQLHEVLSANDLLDFFEIDRGRFDTMVNGYEVAGDYILSADDVIECIKKDAVKIKKQAYIHKAEDLNSQITIESVPEKPQVIQSEKLPENSIVVRVNEKQVVIDGGKQHYIFVDIFNFINFDLSKPQGNIVLRLNGKQAAFTDTIRDGDQIEIYWDK